MDYLKFNCYDLAAQNLKLHSIHRNMSQLSKELSGVLDALDPQLKDYENLHISFRTTNQAVNDIASNILTAHNVLDQITDRYYDAEHRTLQTSQELPTSIPVDSSAGFVAGTPAGITARIADDATAGITTGIAAGAAIANNIGTSTSISTDTNTGTTAAIGGAGSTFGITAAGIPNVSTSVISSSTLVLETWLAEIVHRANSDDESENNP